jgi:hypothetical protein
MGRPVPVLSYSLIKRYQHIVYRLFLEKNVLLSHRHNLRPRLDRCITRSHTVSTITTTVGMCMQQQQATGIIESPNSLRNIRRDYELDVDRSMNFPGCSKLFNIINMTN